MLIKETMNIILFQKQNLDSEDCVWLDAQSSFHAKKQLKVSLGDTLKAGIINGPSGDAEVVEIGKEKIRVSFKPGETKVIPSPWVAAVALPRPKTLGKKVQTLVELGVKQIIFFDCTHVDKSYWTSEWLSVDRLAPYIRRGLEQACDTHWPLVMYFRSYKRFIAVDWSVWFSSMPVFVAHPSLKSDWPLPSEPSVGVIGPERGFTNSELQDFKRLGAEVRGFGARVLSTEIATTQAFRLG